MYRDMEVVRALYAASFYLTRDAGGEWRNTRWSPFLDSTWQRPSQHIVVTFTERHWQYSQSAVRKSSLVHAVRYLLIAWRRGKPVGALVRYWCGQKSQTFELIKNARLTCRRCKFQLEGQTGLWHDFLP